MGKIELLNQLYIAGAMISTVMGAILITYFFIRNRRVKRRQGT